MKKVVTFKELTVWKSAIDLSRDVSRLVRTFPKSERYALSDDLLRASRSVAANIAEGFGRYHFNDKLVFYDRSGASLDEVENHLVEALNNGYVGPAFKKTLEKKASKVRYLLKRMIRNLRIARDRYDEVSKSHRSGSHSTRQSDFHKRSAVDSACKAYSDPGSNSATGT
jgi:four helix bundle protein